MKIDKSLFDIWQKTNAQKEVFKNLVLQNPQVRQQLKICLMSNEKRQQLKNKRKWKK